MPPADMLDLRARWRGSRAALVPRAGLAMPAAFMMMLYEGRGEQQ